MKNINEKSQIVIVSNAVSDTNRSSEVSLHKFVKVLEVATKSRISVVSGNINEQFFDDTKAEILSLKRSRSNKLLNIFNYLFFQIKAGVLIWKNCKRGTKTFFWIADGMILPYYIAKIKKATIFYFIYGNPYKIQNARKSESETAKRILKFANKADFVCAENIGVFDEWGSLLKNQSRKIIHLYSNIYPVSKSKKNIFGVLSRISEGKHIPEIIEAFSKFHKEHENWVLEIVGSGSLLNKCESIVQRKKMTGVIKFYGWIHPDKLNNILSNWSFLIFPTDTEGVPNTVIEAMGRGIPCIASSVGALKNIINNKNGFILSNTDSTSILMSLNEAAKLSDYDQMSENARHTIEKDYSLNAAVKTIKFALSTGEKKKIEVVK